MPINAFTVKANGRLNSIVTEIGVSPPILTGQSIPKNHASIIQTQALWDTGATNSVITTDTVSRLNLKPIGVTQVSHAGGRSNANVYLVNIYLPNNMAIPGVRVTEAPQTTGQFGAIIGMDIITIGDLALTNVNGKTTFTFRIPATKELDFVKEIKPQPIVSGSKIGRNDECPCGSGKKYKQCHGK
jgi:hypothetical protein